MNIKDLQDLGFTPEQLFDRVADNVTEKILTSVGYDANGEFDQSSKYMVAMSKKVKARIDLAIADIVEKRILPGIPAQIEDIAIQATNQWGEKKGEKMTFVEYLIDRSNFYINEMVDYEGKSRAQKAGSMSGFIGTQTRLTSMIDKHLHYNIEKAMKMFISDANKELSCALAETAKIKMEEIGKKLKVTVK